MKRVPIKVAKKIADEHGFPQVILCAWDGEKTHIVTYGATPEDCAQAAQGGNRIKDALGWPRDLHADPPIVAGLRKRLADAHAALRKFLKPGIGIRAHVFACGVYRGSGNVMAATRTPIDGKCTCGLDDAIESAEACLR